MCMKVEALLNATGFIINKNLIVGLIFPHKQKNKTQKTKQQTTIAQITNQEIFVYSLPAASHYIFLLFY